MTDVTYAIGDIHGCYYQLDKILELIRKDKRPDESAEIVFIGDYVDRGPEVKKVLDRVMANDDSIPFICLQGNHEQMCLEAYDGIEFMNWQINGGKATDKSFLETNGGRVPNEYLEWMRGLPIDYETDHYIFVHAGLAPGQSKDETHPDDKLWIRQEFLYSNYDWGKPVVHGHTPMQYPIVKSNRISIDTGAVFGHELTAAILRGSEEPLFIQVPMPPGVPTLVKGKGPFSQCKFILIYETS